MKPFVIKNPEKIYSEEELQKDSAYPLFEDFYIGENPENVSIYNSYKNVEGQHFPLEEKYSKLLPEYMQIFSKKISIGPGDEVKVEMELSEECIKAMQIKHSLKNKPTKKEIVEILKKDMDDFYKKFGAEKAIRALNP